MNTYIWRSDLYVIKLARGQIPHPTEPKRQTLGGMRVESARRVTKLIVTTGCALLSSLNEGGISAILATGINWPTNGQQLGSLRRVGGG